VQAGCAAALTATRNAIKHAQPAAAFSTTPKILLMAVTTPAHFFDHTVIPVIHTSGMLKCFIGMLSPCFHTSATWQLPLRHTALQTRRARLLSCSPPEVPPSHLYEGCQALRCEVLTSSGAQLVVVLGGPFSVLANTTLVEHALRQTLVGMGVWGAGGGGGGGGG